tara:strand:- start:143 stop:448 length:306 start_codon:yes stop_codon:yes gene_type:complete
MFDIGRVKQLASSGDDEYQCCLGLCYQDGEGVSEDGKKSMYWLTKSAKQGNAEAQFFLGFNYYAGINVQKNTNKSIDWLTKSAKQSDVLAVRLLEHVKSKL